MDTTLSNKKIEDGRYIESVGRRKTSIARVRLMESKTAKGTFTVNEKPVTDYFRIKKHNIVANEALSKVKASHKFIISTLVRGGGIASQAEAVRHGLARALVAYDGEWRDRLKKAGFLKRDSRAKERRKFGLKKARKAPQWSKR